MKDLTWWRLRDQEGTSQVWLWVLRSALGGSQKAQWVKELAAKPEGLSFVTLW